MVVLVAVVAAAAAAAAAAASLVWPVPTRCSRHGDVTCC